MFLKVFCHEIKLKHHAYRSSTDYWLQICDGIVFFIWCIHCRERLINLACMKFKTVTSNKLFVLKWIRTASFPLTDGRWSKGKTTFLCYCVIPQPSPTPAKTNDPLTRGLGRYLILVIFSCINFLFPTQSEISGIALISRTLTSLFSQNYGKLVMFSAFFWCIYSFDDWVWAIFASRNFNLGFKFKSLTSQAADSYMIYLLRISWFSKEAMNGNYWRDWLMTYKKELLVYIL